MIENILIIDTETTGLEPKKGAQLIEIAAILFNIPHKTILQQFSTLLPCETNPVEHINKIKAEGTRCRYPFLDEKVSQQELEEIWTNPQAVSTVLYEEKITLNAILLAMLEHADACVAHNAQFDKKFLALLPCADSFLSKKWICTKANFTWPVRLERFSLQHICQAMDVPYVEAHRALNDCNLLVRCFEKVEDLSERFNQLAA